MTHPSPHTPTVSVRQFFKAKTLVLTGGSGFVGKVLLWTILHHLDCKHIYLILRSKKCPKTGQLKATPPKRLENEIFGSPIFADLPPDKRSLVSTIEGDVERDEPLLGLALADHAAIIQNAQIILHGAASVRFQATLRENMNTNTLGTLRMLALAKQCLKLEAMVHVSTAYVNSDLGTGVRVQERVYTPLSDPEELLNVLIKATDPDKPMTRRTRSAIRRLQGSHFNTYTFTKQLAEHLLVRRRGSVRLAICRPTIIGSAWQYPKPGWVDTALGAGALFAAGASGLIARVPGRPSVIGDQIPVDLVCHTLLVAASAVATGHTHLVCPRSVTGSDTDNVLVAHCSSSTSNPISWEKTIEVVQAYFQTYPLSTDQRAVPKFDFVESTLVFSVLHYLCMIYPALLIALVFRMLAYCHRYFDRQKKRAEFRLKMARLGHNMAYAFAPFTCMEWFFESKHVQTMAALLDSEEEALFLMDAKKIHWDEWLVEYAIGLRTVVLKDPPKHHELERGTRNTLMQVTSRRAAELVSQSLLDLRKTQRLVTAACQKEIKDNSELLKWTSAQLNPIIVFPAAWGIHRALQTLFSAILVDSGSLSHFRSLHEILPPPSDVLPSPQARCKHPVLLIPTHKSYFDFIVLSYACLAFDLRLPLVAADEVFASLPLVTRLLRATGAFFLQRGGSSTELSNILRIYFTKSLLYHCWVQFFIEGSRSRTGFLLRPKRGLLAHALSLVESQEIESLRVLPIGINYGEHMEARSLCDELVGVPKVGESVGRILWGVEDVIRELLHDSKEKDKFHQARISIKAGPPLTFQRSDCDPTSAGWKITHALQDLRQVSLRELLAWSLLLRENSSTAQVEARVLELVAYISALEPGRDRTRIFGLQMNRLSDQIEQHLLGQRPFRDTFLQDKSSKEWRIIETSSATNRNLMLNRVQYYRGSILDLLGVDAFLAFTLEKLRPESEEELLMKANEVAKLIDCSALGHRFGATSDERKLDAIRRLKQGSGDLRRGLCSLMEPLINGLRFFVDFYERRHIDLTTTVSSVSTIDSERLATNEATIPATGTKILSECRRVAAQRNWPVGAYPILDREVLRFLSKTPDFSQIDDVTVTATAAAMSRLGIS